jgi:hypothetical protein
MEQKGKEEKKHLAALPHFEGLNCGISSIWVFKSPLHLSQRDQVGVAVGVK